MISGYVLIKAKLGKAHEVAAKVIKVKGVKGVCAVTGSFDAIATFEVETPADIAKVVAKEIHGIEGVCSTETAICTECHAR